MKVSVVIPALNEESSIAEVIAQIPIRQLNFLGYYAEVVVADNNSTDRTAEFAKRAGAKVVLAAKRGYGEAFKAGFAAAEGDIIITGDADMTYPMDVLPQLLEEFIKGDWDFMNTDRLKGLEKGSMSPSHIFGNHLFVSVMRRLFPGNPYDDSQSGMWIFKKSILPFLHLREGHFAFSQEIKIEAFVRGFKCTEVVIPFRSRHEEGQAKLNTISDGIKNMSHLFRKRLEVWLGD